MPGGKHVHFAISEIKGDWKWQVESRWNLCIILFVFNGYHVASGMSLRDIITNDYWNFVVTNAYLFQF